MPSNQPLTTEFQVCNDPLLLALLQFLHKTEYVSAPLNRVAARFRLLLLVALICFADILFQKAGIAFLSLACPVACCQVSSDTKH